jgi:hypothetical protein
MLEDVWLRSVLLSRAAVVRAGQTDVVTDDGWISALATYAGRLHAHAGPDHHVVSALGAWMLVALCAPLADDETRAEMAEVLGADPTEAAQFAAKLLAQPHPLVAAAAGVWIAPAVSTPAMEQWRAGLPTVVTTGDIPTQEALDAWATACTLGLIEHFPLKVTPELVCLLATALATKVSWEVPFDVVDAKELAPSPWVTGVQRVLSSPGCDPRHRQYIAETDRAGTVGVHLTGARGGLLVGSVIATDQEVPAADVLAVAHTIVSAEAREPRSVASRSLFDLPLGDGAIWSITEEAVETKSRDGREEAVTSILPAWSADTTVDLDHEDLGYPAAARAIKKVLGLPGLIYDAKQTALARYSAVGFEAAAITHLAMAMSRPSTRPGYRRDATVRFGHPFAVVAVAGEDRQSASSTGTPNPWDGLPVFSAWVSEPGEVEGAETQPRN